MSESVDPRSTSAALAELHDSIYREKVLRARSLSVGERCSDVFELSSFQFQLLFAGAAKRAQVEKPETVWAEVARGLERLRKVHESDLYAASRR